MIGPKIMLCNIADVKSLNISPPQMIEMKKIDLAYDSILSAFYNRYFTIQLNPLRQMKQDDIEKEILALSFCIQQIEQDRDCELLRCLNFEQRRQFDMLSGTKLPINWEPESLFEVPFVDKIAHDD